VIHTPCSGDESTPKSVYDYNGDKLVPDLAGLVCETMVFRLSVRIASPSEAVAGCVPSLCSVRPSRDSPASKSGRGDTVNASSKKGLLWNLSPTNLTHLLGEGTGAQPP